MSFTDMLAGRRTDESDPPVRPTFLWFALTAGMAAWMVHLVGGSILVPAACEHGIGWTIDALTVATAIACVLGVLAGVKVHRRAGSTGDPRSEAYRLLSYLAISSNAISAALVVAEGAMHIWVSACR